MTKVVGAGAAEALIYELRQRLPSSRDAVVLLVNAALAEDRDRNRIASEALAASARKALVLVRLDQAEAPIGLRDMPAFPWTPGSPLEREQISAITAAVNSIEPDMLSRPAPAAAPRAPTAARGGPSKRTLIAGGAGAVVLALAAVLLLHKGPSPSASSESPPPSPPMTAGAEAPNNDVAGAEAPNAAAPNNDLNATAGANNPSPAAPAEPTPDSQQAAPPPRGQMGMAAFAVAAIILLLASLAVQVLGLLTQINGPRWLREQTDKLWSRLPSRRTPKVVAASAAQAPAESKSPIVFASYSRKDREAVDPLIVDFETQGLPVWLDRVDIAGGVICPRRSFKPSAGRARWSCSAHPTRSIPTTSCAKSTWRPAMAKRFCRSS